MPHRQLSCLTRRQRQVLQLAAGGASNAEIGQALDISIKTVEQHIRNIVRRYGLSGRTQVVVRGIVCGDVDEMRAYADVEGRRRVE